MRGLRLFHLFLLLDFFICVLLNVVVATAPFACLTSNLGPTLTRGTFKREATKVESDLSCAGFFLLFVDLTGREVLSALPYFRRVFEVVEDLRECGPLEGRLCRLLRWGASLLVVVVGPVPVKRDLLSVVG